MRFARTMFLIVAALALMALAVTPAQARPDDDTSARNDAAVQGDAAEQVMEQLESEAATGGPGLEMAPTGRPTPTSTPSARSTRGG